MMEGPETSVRILHRAMLALLLLLGGGAGDWAPLQGQTHESCCCGPAAGMEERCPCPKPEGNRGPSRTLCTDRAAAVASPTVRQIRSARRIEARPEPATWAEAVHAPEPAEAVSHEQGRDPDLGRHLARLNLLRI